MELILILVYCLIIPTIHCIVYFFDDSDDFLQCRNFIEYLHCDSPKLNTTGILFKRLFNSFCYVYLVLFLVVIYILELFIHIYNFIFYKKEI